tara:strand:+ start:589 stop:4251 length:3663 start_codon:yes stop_codon:yes gene_type:complete
MANTWRDTFKPVNVAEEKDSLGQPLSPPIVSWRDTFEAVEETVEQEREPVPLQKSNLGSVQESAPTETVTSWRDVFEPAEELPATEGPLVGLPVGVKANTYSENDLSENEVLYNPIFDYVKDRYGSQAVRGKDRADVVNTFLNNRRGNASGNSVRAFSEADYLIDIRKNNERLLKAGKAYAIFEGMESLTGKGVTWGETFSGLGDYARSVLLDPVNLATMGIGKIFGGTAIRAAGKSVEKIAMKEVSKQLVNGAAREAAEKAGTEVLRKTSANAAVEGTAEIAQFAATMAANKGVSRVLTKAGLKEVGAATVVDAAVNSGTEFLYQRSLVETNVQGEISKSAVGIAALSSIAMGGLQAGLVMRRGVSDTALVSETVKKAEPKAIAKELQESISSWVDDIQKAKVGDGPEWFTKVKEGKDLTEGDTDFFIDLLLGINDADGNVQLKGLAQTMQEGGYFFVKRNEDDKISNWIADFMVDELDQTDIDGIMGAFGKALDVKIKGKLTPEMFSNAFANKINSSARSMNSVMQVAKKLDVNIEDLDLDGFFREALGLNVIKDPEPGKMGKAASTLMARLEGTVVANITEIQNKFIRTLVSHPSTSALNVLGYGVAAGLDVATDITMALYKGTKGTLQSVVGMADAGKTHRYVAKQLLLASKDRIKFALDPDMTYAAYRSALERNTGALDTLNRTLSGGVDISNSVKQMVKLGGRGGQLQDKADTIINGVQQATFVHAQDAFTKSQEYVSQMNKLLRTDPKFGMSWNDFYTSPDAVKVMATKEYKELEMRAVTATLENTFSKSYKDSSKLGELAGFIEDARNIPGLGFMVPFGRFFNNTIDFGVKNTPFVNIAVKATGKYADRSVAELNARGAVVVGLVYSLAQDEDKNRREGLGLYDEIVDGQIISQQYDYPLSLFKAAARVISYKMAGEEVPSSIISQIGKDFGGGGLTRNLNKTTAEFADLGSAILSGELGKAWSEAGGISGDITAQALSGFLRPLEPLDTALGLLMNTSQSPKDTAQGNKFVGDSLRYIDTTANFLLGKSDPVKVSSAAGELDQQSTKNVGVRTVSLTDTQRLMNVLGIDQWSINSGLSKDKKRMIPEAVNEYQRQVYIAVEEWSSIKMNNEFFLNATQEEQSDQWKAKIKEVRDQAKFMLVAKYNGPQTTLRNQYDIMSKFSIPEVEEAIVKLELGKPISELSLTEITMLNTQLNIKDYVRKMKIDPRTLN